MESSLHRALKHLFAGPAGRVEVRMGKFRVDAVIEGEQGQELIEIQHGPLWSIRDKIRRLTQRHRVRIVKPVVGRTRYVNLSGPNGHMVSQRFSPKRGQLLELFDELVYFTRAFPHPKLSLEVLLVDVEERRFARRKRLRRGGRFVVEDQRLLAIRKQLSVVSAADLLQLIPCSLPSPFHTAHLAEGLQIDRFTAQRIAYVLRQSGAVETVGKLRGALLYQWRAADWADKAA